jgi:hypothetical protein
MDRQSQTRLISIPWYIYKYSLVYIQMLVKDEYSNPREHARSNRQIAKE